jgi:hypothetical protein
MPVTKNLEQDLTGALYGRDQDELSVRFNLDALLRADSQARGEFYRVLVELGILTRNEVRELENRNPLDGLDEPLTPLNMSAGDGEPTPKKGEARPPAGDGPPSRRPSEPAPDEEDQARARAILRRVAARVLRKEIFAFAGAPGKKGAAERFAGDAEGWRAEVSKFYERHVELLGEALMIEPAAAAAYCADHRRQLLEAGLAAVQLWGEEEVDRLLGLALGR